MEVGDLLLSKTPATPSSFSCGAVCLNAAGESGYLNPSRLQRSLWQDGRERVPACAWRVENH